MKRLIKCLLPPLLLDLIRRRPPFANPSFTWEGVYANLRDVPSESGTYDNDARIEEFLDRTRAALALVRAGKKPDSGWHEPLGLLAAAISANRSQIRVLDFGGGVGLAFVELLATLRNNATVSYHVVDLGSMCVAGRQLFANDSRIQFYTSLPELHDNVDIAYASSVLPYVEDYAELLRQLAALKAPYILLTQLAAGGFPTYAARQLNLSGQVLAYWFLNLDEVISIVGTAGYSLVYDAQEGPEYDQSNYPETYRVGRMRTLLFVRS